MMISPASAEKSSAGVEQSKGGAAAGLSEAKSEEVSQAVDTALVWLAEQQQPDGRFSGPSFGQPGITSLTVMAFLSAGHLPGQGPYGKHLEKAIDYALGCEIEDGLFCTDKPRPVWGMDKPLSHGDDGHPCTFFCFLSKFL